MVDRLVAVDDADYRLPGPVRQALASELADEGDLLGGQVHSLVDSGVREGGKGAFASPRPKTAPSGQEVAKRFQPGHGWGLGTGATEDTSDKLFGSQSLRLTTDGAGGARSTTITGLAPMNWSNVGMFRLWMMVDNPARLNRIEIRIGSSVSGWTDYFRNPVTDFALGAVVPGQYDARTAGPGIWMPIEIPKYLFTAGAGAPNWASITRLGIYVYDKAGGAVNINVNSFEALPVTTPWPNGVISLDFDDNYASAYELGLPIMSAYGFRGTAFLINETVGSHASYMTLEQIRDLQDFHGWEIDTHSQTAAAHTSGFDVMSPTALDAELRAAKAWLIDHGFHGQHLAYPKGQYTTDVVRTAERYFTTSRTVKLTHPNWIGPVRPHELAGIPVTNVSTIEAMKSHVDRAKSSGIPRHFIFHRLEAGSTPVNAIAWGTVQFAELLAYIAAQGVPVATYGEIYQA